MGCLLKQIIKSEIKIMWHVNTEVLDIGIVILILSWLKDSYNIIGKKAMAIIWLFKKSVSLIWKNLSYQFYD